MVRSPRFRSANRPHLLMGFGRFLYGYSGFGLTTIVPLWPTPMN